MKEVCKDCGSTDLQTITECTSCGLHVDIDMNKIMFHVVDQTIKLLNEGIDGEDLFASVEEVVGCLQVVKNVLTDPDSLEGWRDLEQLYVPKIMTQLGHRLRGSTRDGRTFVSQKVKKTLKDLDK